jgi:hypothetical protein
MKILSKALFLLIFFISCNEANLYDLIILNGTVYDGSLDNPAQLDIGIKGDEIVTLGSLASENADKLLMLLDWLFPRVSLTYMPI